MRGLLCGVVLFVYFGIFLECVIMGKRGRSEKYFISCAVSGSKIF